MSLKALNWAHSVALSSRGISHEEFRVLINLSDCHHDGYGCYPSNDRISEWCEMSVDRVEACLTSLEAKGLISRGAPPQLGHNLSLELIVVV